jgi:hypothetical protein
MRSGSRISNTRLLESTATRICIGSFDVATWLIEDKMQLSHLRYSLFDSGCNVDWRTGHVS